MTSSAPVHQGLLLQADMARSKKIQSHLGESPWLDYQAKYFAQVIALAQSFNLKTPVLMWDALAFTSDQILTPEQLKDFTHRFLKLTTTLAQQAQVDHLLEDPKKSGRCVATLGDIFSTQNAQKEWDLSKASITQLKSLEDTIKGTQYALVIHNSVFQNKDTAGVPGLRPLPGSPDLLVVTYDDLLA